MAARWAIWRAEKARRAADDRGRGVSAAAVFDALSRHLPADAVVTVDVGNHAYSLGRYLESKGQPVLMSGYLGSIGFGYPAALGAWAAAPGRPVVAVTGDGGFGQYAAELTTAVKYGIPIKHVLLDNHSLGKIGKEQLAAGFPVWHTSLHNPDWAAYARLCGATGIKADRPGPARGRHDPAVRRRRPRHAARRAGPRAAVEPRNSRPSSPRSAYRWMTRPRVTSDLRALVINCTLKRSPERSHTQGLIDRSPSIMEKNGVRVEPDPGGGPRHRDRRVAGHDRARLARR